MRPINIIPVRHGQSQGNADRSLYASIPDYAIQLTETGRLGAFNVGAELSTKISGPVMFYVSPYWRTRQTYSQIAKHFPNHQMREDCRIREQDWGNLRERDATSEIEKMRDGFGSFFFRFPDGESGADVEDRISSFLDTMHRDFEKPNFPPNVILVTHGFTMRVFIKRWLHMTTEQFESLANPKNCEYYHLALQADNKHRLVNQPRAYSEVNHEWVFPKNQ